MRRRSSAHSIREPTGFTTPSPRLVRGRLPPAFSLSPPRSGDVPSPLATNADASSGFFALRFFFLARGALALARLAALPAFDVVLCDLHLGGQAKPGQSRNRGPSSRWPARDHRSAQRRARPEHARQAL